MLRLFLRKKQPTMAPPPTDAYYRTASVPPLAPQQVRERTFIAAGIGRRGFDANDVRKFLHRAADDLAAARAELAWVRDENDRIKHALRQWQTDHARMVAR